MESKATNPAIASPPSTDWHTLSPEEVESRLSTDSRRGLPDDEAERRLARHGPNELAPTRPRSAAAIFLAQFRSIIVLLLLAATIIALLLGEALEAGAIAAVIVLNALFGFFTEWRAERALDALKRSTTRTARVLRGGVQREIQAGRLVPGDVVVLDAGARVPADGRIVESEGLQIDESILTGESRPADKSTTALSDPQAPVPDRRCIAYLGTSVVRGRGKVVVVGTGPSTEVGRIGLLLEAAEPPRTPLELKLDRLGRDLILVVFGVCAVVVAAGWLRGVGLLQMLEIGISLAIAAAPEGLPAVATMTLAVGMHRMARRKALVRRLAAVEALGAVTVICTDKTGTLTKNEMTVTAMVVGGQQVVVTGAGYSPTGGFETPRGKELDAAAQDSLRLAVRIGALCNDARLDRGLRDDHVIGDPTEAALLVLAEKMEIEPDALRRDYPRLAEIPFDSRTKRMTTVHRTPSGEVVALMKGSPGTLLERSSSLYGPEGPALLTPEDRRSIEDENRRLAGSALRVLGLAYRELPETYEVSELEHDLVFVGLVGMTDPLREEAKEAVATCRAAGIRVVMITGDQPATAAEIGRLLEIDRDAAGRPLTTVHGRDIEALGEQGLGRLVATSSVFARVSPQHKLMLVDAYQKTGHVAAMTGDGVNDAPALKKADVGVAMGVNGAEVAKEAAALVITDDNFATIVEAVRQGRVIYSNLLKFIHYLFSCNVAEIITVFVATLMGLPSPLTALQILWLNLLTDVFPAMALAVEPAAANVMKRPPRSPKQELLDRPFLVLIGWQGTLLAACTLGAFLVALQGGTDADDIRRAQTAGFLTLAFGQIVHAFNARSRRRSIFSGRFFSNPWLWAAVLTCGALQVAAVSVPLLQQVLHTAPPQGAEWLVVLSFSLVPLVVVELVKWVGRHRSSLP